MPDSVTCQYAVLRLSRVYPASREAVFAAWTDPSQIAQWLCPQGAVVTHVEVNLQVGGSFRIDMTSSHGTAQHTGVYQEIRPPEKLVFTWVSMNTGFNETLVTIELFERENGTELVLTQRGLPEEKAYQAHTIGWNSILEKLAHQLSTVLGKE